MTGPMYQGGRCVCLGRGFVAAEFNSASWICPTCGTCRSGTVRKHLQNRSVMVSVFVDNYGYSGPLSQMKKQQVSICFALSCEQHWGCFSKALGLIPETKLSKSGGKNDSKTHGKTAMKQRQQGPCNGFGATRVALLFFGLSIWCRSFLFGSEARIWESQWTHRCLTFSLFCYEIGSANDSNL